MSTLMVSISGIRGIVGDGLDPEVIVKYTNAYSKFIGSGKVIVGRDARITGEMVNQIVTGTLLANGLDVIDIGICPTPTVQFTVKSLNADGGIAISASHNPNEWNALKLLNSTGQFMSPDQHEKMKTYLSDNPSYKSWDKIGKRTVLSDAIKNHVDAILNLPIINVDEIRRKKFKVVADCVNGAGAYCIPDLLKSFGCEVIELNCEKTGIFPRLPEPLPENLTETMKAVRTHKADFAVVVDPDVDRLVLITDKGEPFIEENTVTIAIDFVLSKTNGNVAVNLSTSRSVDDIAKKYNSFCYRSPVGEANVVKKMKEVNAVIGGEGSGGVIYPALHYGRDALVGIALVLQYLTDSNLKLSEIKDRLPQYYISKKKIDLNKISPDSVLNNLIKKYSSYKINTEDGLRIDFDDHWVHFRKSNTEPIIRIITESGSQSFSEELSEKYFDEIKSLMKL
ncbi:MAG: phosphoglucosamine mutase [Ignavibacteriales bacterium UTCHB2]|jgi:phosphomannomutase|nr:MAG: Phosphomannomutase/phosphoglucomutase [Ignavibacteria bacterium ADurb.Bin266]OQY71129.1 MAG: phosphoglucosamine mutase [Ignavibacteriales bacterium UTCHB2]HQI39808.1 phosphoglucosamine mutase [Ignavibacteriaceae bacterium]